MPTQINLWRVDDGRPVAVPREKLDLESRIEDWLRHDISLISDDLLVIGQQVETAYGGCIDLLALDGTGNLVILELKRDKTPRDIVAQVLDYASWAQGLGHESIQEIANAFLEGKTLDQAFQEKFHTDLPDVLNKSHRMYIVASALDSATERIVKYLSETHNVDINVATFAYFKTGDVEFLGRSFLLDETAVQTRAETKSKHKPALSWEELRELAEQNGVEHLYKRALSELKPLFNGTSRSRSNVAFVGNMGGAKNVIVGVYPGLSTASDGLAVTLYLNRVNEYFSVNAEQVRPLLGDNVKDVWSSDPDSTWYAKMPFLDDRRLGELIAFLRKAKEAAQPSEECNGVMQTN